MIVGVGASRVRELFAEARKVAPSIIFIDEIDTIGRTRGGGASVSGHDEREQTLNQILTEMDGFTGSEGVIVIAATNRADILDPALTRPGRFDRVVSVSPPDRAGREAILGIHTREIPLAPRCGPGPGGPDDPGHDGSGSGQSRQRGRAARREAQAGPGDAVRPVRGAGEGAARGRAHH